MHYLGLAETEADMRFDAREFFRRRTEEEKAAARADQPPADERLSYFLQVLLDLPVILMALRAVVRLLG